MRLFVLVLLACLFAGEPIEDDRLLAQGSGPRLTDCVGQGATRDPASIVAACSAVIADSEAPPSVLALALLNRGIAQAGQGDRAAALRDFKESLRLRPTAEAYMARATVLAGGGDFAAARDDYDEAIRLSPRSAAAFNGRCWVRALIGQFGPAHRDCEISLMLRPDHPATLDSRGLVHLRLGQCADAVADFDAALARDATLASSLLGRGICRLRQGDAVAGRRDLLAAEQLAPGIVRRYLDWGILTPFEAAQGGP